MASNTTSKSVDKVQHNVDGHILADYTIHRRIGKGAYGIVYKAYDKKNKQYTAIKKIFDAFCNKTDAQRTYREILFLKSFQRHPNIITMLDVFKALNNKDLYVIFEYMENDLNKVIKEKILKDVHIRFIMFQLCNGLAYIHGCNVMHRDLKPSNILINKSCSIKIADLGLARSLNDRNECLTEYIATRWYRAPEILISKGQYTHRVDIWSLGCILAEMLQSKPLFPGASTNHQLQLIVNMIRTNPPHADKFYAGFKNKPEDAVDLLDHILILNPENRPEAEQMLEHGYIKKYFPSTTHPKPQLTTHPIVLDIDDNNQLEINDYRDVLYDIVVKRRKKQSMKRSSKHHVPDGERVGDMYVSQSMTEKENQNRNHIAAPTREKAKIKVLESVQVVNTKFGSNCDFHKSTNDVSVRELNGHEQNKKDYISYNKNNIVNLTHDKTKTRKQYAVNQEAPVLVTSKTYSIHKNHVKNVKKTWLDPSAYASKEISCKNNRDEYNIVDQTYQTKLNHKQRELNTNSHYVDTKSIPIISCEEVESKLLHQNSYHSHYNSERKKQPGEKSLENGLPYCSSQNQTGQRRYNQVITTKTDGIHVRIPQYQANTTSTDDINVRIPQYQANTTSTDSINVRKPHYQGNTTSPDGIHVRKPQYQANTTNIEGISVRIPQVPPPPKTGGSPLTRHSYKTRLFFKSNGCKEPKVAEMWSDKESQSQIDISRLQVQNGLNYNLGNGEEHCNNLENGMLDRTSPQSPLKCKYGEKKVNSNCRHVDKNNDFHKNAETQYTYPNEIKEKLSRPAANMNAHSHEMTTKKIRHVRHINDDISRSPSMYNVSHVPTKNCIGDGRRHSDSLVHNKCHSDEIRTLCNGHAAQRPTQYPYNETNSEVLENHTNLSQTKLPPSKNFVFDKIMNCYSNNNKNGCFVSTNCMNNESQTPNGPIIDGNLSKSQSYYRGSNKSNENHRNNDGSDIFHCFKKNHSKGKTQFDYNTQFSDKLNNMHKLSVLNFNINPISMEDSDFNEDGPADSAHTRNDSHPVKLLKPDLNEYVSVSSALQPSRSLFCRYL